MHLKKLNSGGQQRNCMHASVDEKTLPGTPMYDFVKENGWLRVTDFDKYDTATPIFDIPAISMQELREIREQALQRFYLRPTYFLSMLSKGRFWSFSISRTVLAHLRRAIISKLMGK